MVISLSHCYDKERQNEKYEHEEKKPRNFQFEQSEMITLSE